MTIATPSVEGRISLSSPAIRLHPLDDVVVARVLIPQGTSLPQENIVTLTDIPAGHKVAVRAIAQGAAVKRYGQIIGFASAPIAAGAHVHTHNLSVGEFARDYAFAADAKPQEKAEKPSFFQGIIRPDGRVATRNYIGILTSVNCAATVARAIADQFRRDIRPEALADFPNIDGVVALPHGVGCAVDPTGEGLAILRRTLGGYAVNPNFAAIMVIGLGCETNQIQGLIKTQHLEEMVANKRLHHFTIQDIGGTTNAVARGVELVKELMTTANQVQREPVSASHLVVGLQCGGSDGYSGISANPALGAAVDLLVAQGGTAILSETPEIYGAEHLLTRRAESQEVGEKLLKRIAWWEAYCAKNNASMDNNPSAGNKAGGLTTVLEKSLGGIAKAGHTNLIDVYEYAETVEAKGLVFMDTPGYDPISVTGQVAGGANLIVFTTGRGSAFGCIPAPSIKVATNDALWRRQQDDMDLNCGPIISGEKTIPEMGAELFELMLRIASGEPSRSEKHGYGQSEFVPWQLAAIT